MKQMGVAYQKNVNKNFLIKESEVTKTSISKMDIDLILTHLAEYESAVAEGDLNLTTI